MAKHRFNSSITPGEVTLAGPAREEGAGKLSTAIFYDSLHVVDARWMVGANGVRIGMAKYSRTDNEINPALVVARINRA
ncbi:hypothetical protein DLM46_14920 [Paraburkholderia lacunae]|uniref:Uncharacterized protein n=1 Tax=Paraburkholderia lacunae TaxID=2211104 RepID=A0A370N9E5_9BURK|nr:hypothetical protein DLM46_14920 [Paraburkholderia lacunae]